MARLREPLPRRPRAASSQLPGLVLLALCSILLAAAGSAHADDTIKSSTLLLKDVPQVLHFFRDSPAALLLEGANAGGAVLHSPDRGSSWRKIDQTSALGARVHGVFLHPFAKDTAFIIGSGTNHLKTTDAGQSWTAFTTPMKPRGPAPLEFHAQEPTHAIFHAQDCSGNTCIDQAYFTVNGFQSSALLLSRAQTCKFAHSSPEFQLAESKLVFCVAWREGLARGPRTAMDLTLVRSADYFQSEHTLVDFNGAVNPAAAGVVGLSVVQKFITAAVLPAAAGADLDLYVTLDGASWAMAKFPLASTLRENAYTLVESLPYSLSVDVLTGRLTGTLYTSNSNGTYFKTALTDTHRDNNGRTDFERVDWMPGLILANQFRADRGDIVSRISWDEGAHWHDLTPPATDVSGKAWPCGGSPECKLHLHSVTSNTGTIGKLYSEKSSPGILTGVGSVGVRLANYEDSSVFVSRDGGVSWKHVRDGAHHYRQLDSGSLLVLADNEKATDQIHYSKDGGDSWATLKLARAMRVRALMTDADSTSASLIAFGTVRDRSSDRGTYAVVHLDFAGVFARKCGDGDMEPWQLKVAGDCVMGRTMKFSRVKPGAGCLVGRAGSPIPQPEIRECACEEDDYECDLNFEPTRDGKCRQVDGAPDPLLPKLCSGKYMGSSGYRKIPGNVCKGGVTLDTPVERECTGTAQVGVFPQSFPDAVQDAIVLDDGAILVRTAAGDAFRSDDAGRTWKESLKGVALLAQHEHVPARLFMVLTSGDVWYSGDGGVNFAKVNVPSPPNLLGVRLFDFHPGEPDWILYAGSRDCPSGPKCRTEVSVSRDNGKSWAAVDDYTGKCLFSRDTEFRKVAKDMVYCAAYSRKEGSQRDARFELNNDLQLVAYPGASAGQRRVLVPHIVEYFVDHGFLLTAEIKGNELTLLVSTDGTAFTPIQFPPDLALDKRAFTVLASSPSRVFLDVVQSAIDGREHGALFASNDDGTLYSLALRDTNRGGALGSVADFYRPHGTRSVVLANRVMNADALRSGRASQKLVQSFISFNDGGQWTRLPSTECDDHCFVQLHNAASSPFPALVSAASAGGIVFGVGHPGNQDAYLGRFDDADAYLSVTGGRTWTKVARGPHRAAILDRGGFLVAVPASAALTGEVKWTWNYGETWESLALPQPLRVADVFFHANGTTPTAYVHGRTAAGEHSVVAIDFSQYARACTTDDMDRWTLTGSTGDQCALGEKVHRPRRKPGVKCLVGKLDVQATREVCDCDVDDFECDVNHWRDDAGRCVLQGADPDKPANCPDGQEYTGRSGYRRISASACKGGLDLARPVTKICGKENEPAPSMIFHKQFVLDAPIATHLYTAKSTVVVLDTSGQVLISPDEGKSWTRGESSVRGIFVHQTHDVVFLVKDTTLLSSRDAGKSFQSTKFPAEFVDGIPPLAVHPEEPDWLLFNGRVCAAGTGCHVAAFFTKDGGRNWHPMLTNVAACDWARTPSFTMASRTGIVCRIGDVVKYSEDFYSATVDTVLTNVVDLTTEGEFVVAVVDQVAGTGKAALAISRNVFDFGRAQFPANADALQEGYTTLPSHPGSLLLNVALHREQGREFGRLFKSNSNGTLFSVVRDNVAQNDRGFVDYEVLSIPGLAVLNVVDNPTDVVAGKAEKRLKTMMTYDDGSTWSFLRAPATDSRGQRVACADPNDPMACSLHLHSYTERRDPQNVFDAVSAPGLMLGVGNVGAKLDRYTDGNVFLTRDGGKSWREVQKGAFMYEFGDHGAILVLVNDEQPTREIKYSIDEGASFRIQRIVAPIGSGATEEAAVRFSLITTRPDATSQRFLLFGTREGDGKPIMHFVDFATLRQRACVFDKADSEKSDFEPWTLESNKCFYGQRIVYYRRKEGRDCAVLTDLPRTEQVTQNCACTRDDYECDFGYHLDPAGTGNCVPLVATPDPPCDGVTRLVPSGYRKHPLSVCAGGNELHKPREVYCRAGGMSAGGWAALFLVPIGIGGAAFAFMRHKARGGGHITLPDRFPTPGDVVDWFDRIRHRVRYSRLRPQFQAHHSSTSLLEDD
ncbi:vacuolar protein sorting/targeting protein PEP1 [Blastocladiella emersonii ATCC 22665]|nr:vacuolar protein sorting/targeting protein PEP1 [Blastocladiella emersonii ATCC 22665]